MKRVVITGLGMVSAAGEGVDLAWKAVLQGRSLVRSIEHFDTSGLPVTIGAEVPDFDPVRYFDAKDARRVSRFVQFAVAAALECQADSGLDAGQGQERWGVNVGVGIGSIGDICSQSEIAAKTPRRVSPFFIPYTITNMASGLVATRLKFKGPNLCSATACASGTHAVGEAYALIRSGQADVMLAGGAEATFCPLTIAGFANMKALSRRNDDPTGACRPFAVDRDGFVLGEGAGVVMLESYEHAQARGAKVYAELRGFGMSGDAYHISSPPPEGEGAQRCMNAALASAACERQ